MVKMYEEKNVKFLLDPLDSVQAYEEAGKANRHETQYEKGMKALASLDHVQQVTAIEGISFSLLKDLIEIDWFSLRKVHGMYSVQI